MLEPAIRDLATAKNFGTLSFRLPSGQIASHVMWVDATDDHLLINTEIGRAKYKAISANPQVTVTVWNAENPYQYGEVRGTVIGEAGGQEARDHIDTLSQRYLGHDYSTPIGTERVILKIEPGRQRTAPA
ncbi:MAG: pyridoxamine 5'-phosphate oxidase family protein [Actinomycetota bacterium]|nr:pyridoxamine 5'-phosphate oxidase family protein [Actinomycetota bacterium]